MTGRVLLVSSPKHAETRALLDVLPGDRTILVDDEWLQRGLPLGWTWSDQEHPLLRLGSERLAPEHILSVFYRPMIRPRSDGSPRTVVLEPGSEVGPDYRLFARREAEAMLLGALWASSARWVNHPVAEYIADHKLHHFTIARELGLRTPRTLISTDPEELVDFWHEMSGEVIVKAVGSRPNLLVPDTLVTRRVTAEDLEVLRNAPRCVTLFQELVPARLDLRVTLVGDETFTTAIHSQEGASPLDWRIDQAVRMTQWELDGATADLLQCLRRRLNLSYGAADLRLTPAGEPVFLEINASGAFIFAEVITGAPITKALADLLLAPALDGGRG